MCSSAGGFRRNYFMDGNLFYQREVPQYGQESKTFALASRKRAEVFFVLVGICFFKSE